MLDGMTERVTDAPDATEAPRWLGTRAEGMIRAKIRQGDETAAARLREHGWAAISPEQLADMPASPREWLLSLGR